MLLRCRFVDEEVVKGVALAFERECRAVTGVDVDEGDPIPIAVISDSDGTVKVSDNEF